MNSFIQDGITLYCVNYLALKKPLFWKSSSYYTKLSALSYALEGHRADTGILLEAINDALEALQIFKDKKCYNLEGREFNLMIAAALVCMGYLIQKNATDTTLLRMGVGTTVEALITAQATICAVSATTAAAAAAST